MKRTIGFLLTIWFSSLSIFAQSQNVSLTFTALATTSLEPPPVLYGKQEGEGWTYAPGYCDVNGVIHQIQSKQSWINLGYAGTIALSISGVGMLRSGKTSWGITLMVAAAALGAHTAYQARRPGPTCY